MKPVLIGLCSPAMFSGKTTVADHLVHSKNFMKLSFATTLKKMTETFLYSTGMTHLEITQRVYGSRKEEVIPALGVTTRHIMQTIGTEWGRDCIDPNVWVKVTLAQAVNFMKHGNSVVIDDLRFPNEYEAIHEAGGDTWRIVRPDARVTVAHASEGQLDRIHMPELFNGGTIRDLRAEVDRLLSRL